MNINKKEIKSAHCAKYTQIYISTAMVSLCLDKRITDNKVWKGRFLFMF